MGTAWERGVVGVLTLPSGRLIRGRSLRTPPPPEDPEPEFGLYLLAHEPVPRPWCARWLQWPDFRLPTDRADAYVALVDVWRRCADQRVEVGCGGGRGRTGTALACLAVLDGVPAAEAVAYVRRNYHPRAVETSWQRRYVASFKPLRR